MTLPENETSPAAAPVAETSAASSASVASAADANAATAGVLGARDRRSFLKTAAAAAAGFGVAPMFVPHSAFGANERVVLAIIGSGGRGRGLMREFMAQGVQFGAVCDVYKPNLAEGVKLAKEKSQDVKEYSNYHELLEKQKGLDGIFIASPEHQHGVHLVDATRAGFDVYCEKPMSHSIKEGQWMVEEVNKTGKIVQVGMQRRSSPIVRKGKEIKDSGVCGEIHYARLKWNWNYSKALDNSPLAEGSLDWKAFCGPAGNVPFEPKKFRYWRYFWPFSGGNITDQGTHIMDVLQWYMGAEFKPALPQYAECFGDVYKMTGSDTPDVFNSTFQYDGFIANWALDYCSAYQNGWSMELIGDKGTLVLDNQGVSVYDGAWDPEDGSDLRSQKKPVIFEKGNLGSTEHLANFIDCLKTRKKTNAPVEVGHLAVIGPHLANIAFHSHERAFLSADAHKTTTWEWWAKHFYGGDKG